jgi:hypothetical protein
MILYLCFDTTRIRHANTNRQPYIATTDYWTQSSKLPSSSSFSCIYCCDDLAIHPNPPQLAYNYFYETLDFSSNILSLLYSLSRFQEYKLYYFNIIFVSL